MKEVWQSALAPLTVLCSWIRKVWDSEWIDVVDKHVGICFMHITNSCSCVWRKMLLWLVIASYDHWGTLQAAFGASYYCAKKKSGIKNGEALQSDIQSFHSFARRDDALCNVLVWNEASHFHGIDGFLKTWTEYSQCSALLLLDSFSNNSLPLYFLFPHLLLPWDRGVKKNTRTCSIRNYPCGNLSFFFAERIGNVIRSSLPLAERECSIYGFCYGCKERYRARERKKNPD